MTRSLASRVEGLVQFGLHANRLAWPPSRVLEWLENRNLARTDESGLVLKRAAQRNLARIEADQRDRPNCRVQREGERTIIEFPADAGILGRIYPPRDQYVTEIARAEGRVELEGSGPWGMFPMKLGDSSDPLRGIDPDVFEEVTMTYLFDRDDDFWPLRHLLGLRRLHVGYGYGNGRVVGGGPSPSLTDLALTACLGMERLEDVSLKSNPITDVGIGLLARISSLRALRLMSTAVSSKGLLQLAQPLRGLAVEFPATPLGSGVDFLRSFPELEELSLRAAGVVLEDRPEVLATLTSLQSLDLGVNARGPRLGATRVHRGSVGDAALAAIIGLRQLERLNLDATDVTEDALMPISNLAGLRSLSLYATGISDRALTAISGLARLEELDIRDTRVTDDGVASLSGHPTLRSLDLEGTRTTGRCVDHLLEIPSLENLHLNERVPLPDLCRLEELPRLKRVQVLHLEDDPEATQQLERALPGVEVVTGFF